MFSIVASYHRIAIVSCSRFIWITNSSDHRRVWTANLLHTKWPSGLGNYFVCKRFAVQTLLWPLEFVIQTNLEHVTIAVWNLARSWSISISSYSISGKTYDPNSRKRQKTSFWAWFRPIGPKFGPTIFFLKIWLCQLVDIMVKYHHKKYQKKLII